MVIQVEVGSPAAFSTDPFDLSNASVSVGDGTLSDVDEFWTEFNEDLFDDV